MLLLKWRWVLVESNDEDSQKNASMKLPMTGRLVEHGVSPSFWHRNATVGSSKDNNAHRVTTPYIQPHLEFTSLYTKPGPDRDVDFPEHLSEFVYIIC